MIPLEALSFFGGREEELALYEALLVRLEQVGPFTQEYHKTQISLRAKLIFGCVSLLRPKPKKELPAHFITLTLGLPRPLASPRIAACVEAQKDRWTHHIVLGDVSDLDEELMGWIREAYDFGNRETGRRKG